MRVRVYINSGTLFINFNTSNNQYVVKKAFEFHNLEERFWLPGYSGGEGVLFV